MECAANRPFSRPVSRAHVASQNYLVCVCQWGLRRKIKIPRSNFFLFHTFFSWPYLNCLVEVDLRHSNRGYDKCSLFVVRIVEEFCGVNAHLQTRRGIRPLLQPLVSPLPAKQNEGIEETCLLALWRCNAHSLGQPLVFFSDFLWRSGSLNNLPAPLFQPFFPKTIVNGTFVWIIQNLVSKKINFQNLFM